MLIQISFLFTVSKTERKGSRFSDAKALVYNVASSQLVNTVQPPPAIRQSSLEHRPPAVDPKHLKSSRRDDHSDDSDSSRKRSKYSTSSSRSSHHRSKHDHYHNHSPSSRHHKKSSRRRSSSSSSDRSSYSRHSDRSKHSERSHKRSRRERSSSRSSHGSSHKRDKHSHERTYSRSHSYKQSRHWIFTLTFGQSQFIIDFSISFPNFCIKYESNSVDKEM